MAVTFTTTVLQAEGKNATGFRIPTDIMTALGGGKRPAVVITVAGYTYRGTVAPYAGDVYMLSLSAEHRTAAGLKAGDTVDLTLELDTAPRTVDVPDDLAAALDAAGVRAAFDALAPSKRKAHVTSVTEAKSQATRDKRIAAVVAQLTGA